MLEAVATVPDGLVHPAFVATPLRAALVALDHEAYTASPDVLRAHSDGRWPTDGFTLAADRELIAGHEADHDGRRAFTYALLDPDRARAVGCLYVRPLDDSLRRSGGAGPTTAGASGAGVPAGSAMVTFWVRQDEQRTGLADVVVAAVHDWLVTAWPLPAHVYRVLPGEESSCAALDRLGLERVRLALPRQDRPYRWYRSAGRPLAA